MTAIRLLFAFIAAVAATTATGSIVQTQFNLAALTAMDVPISLGIRLQTTGHDLLSFTPAFGAIVAAGFLIAFLVAGWLVGRLPQARTGLYALAGAVAVASAMLIMNAIFGLSLVAATRSIAGLAALALAGALGGMVFAASWRRPAAA
jgi:vacuolar-type H+-ATPase subunit I/STV1